VPIDLEINLEEEEGPFNVLSVNVQHLLGRTVFSSAMLNLDDLKFSYRLSVRIGAASDLPARSRS
jgi:hypothetical protein